MDIKTFVKIASGFVVVPMAIAANALWPWWSKTALPWQILSAVAVLPFVAVAAVLTQWWEGY
jgi:hypothetical protein